jgi:PAS domain S-box-containing protein
MKTATPNAVPSRLSEAGWIRRTTRKIDRWIDDLTVAEKLYGIVALLVAVTMFLLAMSVQTLRIQIGHQRLEAASSTAAIGIGRVNALIYASVMESRGIYMSTERTKVREYAARLEQRNHELADVVAELEQTMPGNDEQQFLDFKERIEQFIDFRAELVRRAIEIGPAAARAWGDSEVMRALRSQLNTDLEDFAKTHSRRASEAAELGGLGLSACWYLFALGLAALLFAAVNLYIVRKSVIAPLSDIIRVSYQVARGDLDCEIPYFGRHDEIGRLAVALRMFRGVMERTSELKQRELEMARQRDAVIEERDQISDRYLETKWQLSAAVNSMPAGMIMLDSKAVVLVINDRYRRMYGLPASIKVGSSLQDFLQYGIDSGQFGGSAAQHLAHIVERIGKRQPTSVEVMLRDGRVIRIQESPIDGGGWAALHEDITEQRQRQRLLNRSEQFLAALIETIPEGIVAKDARDLRYVFVNKAAEEMIGVPRAKIVGKSARELFPPDIAELIERRDQQLIAQKQQLEPIIDTIDSAKRGRRTIAVRRLQIGDPGHESHLFVSMFEDRTDSARNAAERLAQ